MSRSHKSKGKPHKSKQQRTKISHSRGEKKPLHHADRRIIVGAPLPKKYHTKKPTAR